MPAVSELTHNSHESLIQAANLALGTSLFDCAERQNEFFRTTRIGEMRTDRELLAVIGARATARIFIDPQTRLAAPNLSPLLLAEQLTPDPIKPELRAAQRRMAMISNFEHFWDDLMMDPKHGGAEPHQLDGLEAFYDFLTTREPGDPLTKSGYFDWATGTGKTFLMAMITRGCGIGTAPNAHDNRPLSAIAFAPRDLIKRQIIGDTTRGFARFAPDLQVGLYDGKHQNDVDIASYQMLVRRAKHGVSLLSEHDLILCDEVHLSLGPQTSKVLRAGSEHNVRVGFTASPISSRQSVAALLKKQIDRITLRDAVEERGILNSLEFYRIDTQREVQADEKFHRLYGDFPEEAFASFIHDEQINNHIYRLVKLFSTHGMHGVMFGFPGQKCLHASTVAEALQGKKVENVEGVTHTIEATAVGTFQSREENNNELRRFEEGSIDLLASVQLVDFGWDSNKVDYIILATPTWSRARLIQRIGRAAHRKDNTRPIIVVYFDYNTGGIRQISPFDALDIPDIPATEKQGFRLERKSQTSGRAAVKVPHAAAKDLVTLLDEIELELQPEGTFIQNASKYNPDHHAITEVAARFDVAPDRLKEILKSHKHRLYRARLPETGEMHSRCDQKAVDFLTENLIRKGEQSIKSMAEELGVGSNIVKARLITLKLYDEGVRRITLDLREKNRPLCYSTEIAELVKRQITEMSLPIQDGEVAISDLSQQTGFTVEAITSWMKSHPKREKCLMYRRPREGIGTKSNHPCIAPPLATAAQLRYDIPAIPKDDKTRLPLRRISTRTLKPGENVDKYIFDLIDQAEVEPQWMRTEHRGRSLFITLDEREKIVNILRERALAERAKRPWRQQRPAQQLPANLLRFRGEPLARSEMWKGPSLTDLANNNNIPIQRLIECIELHPDWRRSAIVEVDNNGNVVTTILVHQTLKKLVIQNAIPFIPADWQVLQNIPYANRINRKVLDGVIKDPANAALLRHAKLSDRFQLTYCSPEIIALFKTLAA